MGAERAEAAERIQEVLRPYGQLEDAALAALAGEVERIVAERTAAADRDRIDAELAVGRRIQRTLIQLQCPDVAGWEIAPYYEPAREVGGDFFDVFRLPDRTRSLALVMADVTGKGIAAALLMAFARPLVHAALDNTRAPAAALERVNWILTAERPSGLFITALAAKVDVAAGEVRLANAGHEPPLLVPGDGGPLRWLPAAGPLLGMFGRLDLVERRHRLGHGDLVVFYTDGATDARSPAGERFGQRRLRSVIRQARSRPAREVVDALVDRLQDWQAGTPAADDVAVVALRRQ